MDEQQEYIDNNKNTWTKFRIHGRTIIMHEYIDSEATAVKNMAIG